jgi:hypothetical protein
MAKAKTTTGAEAAADIDAPGLEWRDRAGGKRVPIWVAAKKAVKAGYQPKTVKLAEDADPQSLAATCRRLQNEMRAWLGSTDRTKLVVKTDGTVAGLIRVYETSPASPINRPYNPDSKTPTGVKFNSRDMYLQQNKNLYNTVGERVLVNITGEQLWQWYDHLIEPAYEGGPEQIARGKNAMGQFTRLVKFGVSVGIEGCDKLAIILTGGGLGSPFRFPNPARRSEQLTHEQLLAFCAAAEKMWHNGKGYMSLALGTILQFEGSVRQADIVGQWWPVSKSENGVLVRDGRQWRGLTWGTHLHPDTFELVKPTSKSKGKKTAMADYKTSPLAKEWLSKIPREQRIGPVVINEMTGVPYDRSAYSEKWRRVARAAGIPDSVQNRDARAGAITEADDAGVEAGRTTRAATHGSQAMNDSYKRENMENARHVLAKRVAARKGAK